MGNWTLLDQHTIRSDDFGFTLRKPEGGWYFDLVKPTWESPVPDLKFLDDFPWPAHLYADIIGEFADDYAGQEGPMFSPRLYRELIVPRQRRALEMVRRYTDAPIFMHQDGAIRPWMEDIIEVGVSILNPIQVSAKGMGDTAALERDFGDRLVFWGGGIDTQSTLSFGTPDEVLETSEVSR
ncbi:MAG: hypothetical protein ISS49_15845 [Anaerolineae bacterium]|nr:hypothetical protein [Anaerolineae bacterium]